MIKINKKIFLSIVFGILLIIPLIWGVPYIELDPNGGIEIGGSNLTIGPRILSDDYLFLDDDVNISGFLNVSGQGYFGGNVGIGTASPRNGLEVATLDSNYVSSIRVGQSLQGTTGGGAGAEMARNQILFSRWRDIVSSATGAKIVGINTDFVGNDLSQETSLAFFTIQL